MTVIRRFKTVKNTFKQILLWEDFDGYESIHTACIEDSDILFCSRRAGVFEMFLIYGKQTPLFSIADVGYHINGSVKKTFCNIKEKKIF